MCERLFDRIVELHKNTLPVTATKHERGLRALSIRLFRSDQYGKKLNCGNRKDVSAVVLIVAYIMGRREVLRRQAYAKIDLLVEYDDLFYTGIWKIICEEYAPDGAIIDHLPMMSDDKIATLARDPDIWAFNLKKICDDYVTYCIFNDLKPKSRKMCAYMFNLPYGWLDIHYLKPDNRPLPIAKIISFMFGMFKFDYLMRPAPNTAYWNTHAYNAWYYLHWTLRNDFIEAANNRLLFARVDTGKNLKSSKTVKYKRKPKR